MRQELQGPGAVRLPRPHILCIVEALPEQLADAGTPGLCLRGTGRRALRLVRLPGLAGLTGLLLQACIFHSCLRI